MDYVIEGIANAYMKADNISLSEESKKELSDYIYSGLRSDVVDNWKNMSKLAKENGFIKEVITDRFDNIIMDTLFTVHDGWVKDNVKKFNIREKKHQHMPSELIGWEEAKADLLFVKPIFEVAGIEVNEERLEQLYNSRVINFFLSNDIKTKEDLAKLISKGEEFYPALAGYDDTLNDIKNPEIINEKIIPQIEEKGIGNIEEVRKNIVPQLINNPEPDAIVQLSDEELMQLINGIEQDVKTLAKESDELKKKMV